MIYAMIALAVIASFSGGVLILTGFLTLREMRKADNEGPAAYYIKPEKSDIRIVFESEGPARIVIATSQNYTAAQSAGPARLGVNISNNQRQIGQGDR